MAMGTILLHYTLTVGIQLSREEPMHEQNLRLHSCGVHADVLCTMVHVTHVPPLVVYERGPEAKATQTRVVTWAEQLMETQAKMRRHKMESGSPVVNSHGLTEHLVLERLTARQTRAFLQAAGRSYQ